MNARGAIARRQLAARARFARELGLRPPRAQRFHQRQHGQDRGEPDLSELRQWPAWPDEEQAVQHRIWALTALVSGRDALLDEIDGTRLRHYAATVGEDCLEHVLAMPRGGNRTLVPPEELATHGKGLAHLGLPAALALLLGLASGENSDAAVWVVQAEAIGASAS